MGFWDMPYRGCNQHRWATLPWRLIGEHLRPSLSKPRESTKDAACAFHGMLHPFVSLQQVVTCHSMLRYH